jgi:hypothetical protein
VWKDIDVKVTNATTLRRYVIEVGLTNQESWIAETEKEAIDQAIEAYKKYIENLGSMEDFEEEFDNTFWFKVRKSYLIYDSEEMKEANDHE